jgi:hypothetical protein
MRPVLFPLLLALALTTGCGLGSDDATPDEGDIRSNMMACFESEGLDAHLEGKEGNEDIVVGEGEDAPRVKFFLTAGESEAEQFQGRGEGAEQIGATWLYTNDGDDDTLETVENCLADQ